MRRYVCRLAPALFALAVLSGCGKPQPSDRPLVYPVRGVVRYHGAPVAGATVVFRPCGEGRGAAGQTDADGHFQLRTFEPGDGAVAGEFVVVVQKGIGDEDWGKKVSEMNFKSTQEYEDWKQSQRMPRKVRGKDLLPRKYAEATTSPLRVTVSAAEPNEFTLNLSD